MKKNSNLLISKFTPWILILCFFIFFVLSWIIVFRDPRAIIGVGNLYPFLKDSLFPIQAVLTDYGLNSIPTIAFAGVSLIAIISYLFSLIAKISLKKTIVIAVIFQLITFFSFPILSTDIFSYIFSERVSTVHHENIWKVKPAAFYPEDQFGVLADWKDTTSVYGAVHFSLYYIPSILGQDDLLSLVILYKTVALLFSLGTLYVLYKLLVHEKIQSSEVGLRMVFWNPLFVLEIIGSGHNDIAMIFFMLLGFYFFRRKLWIAAGVFLALAVQVKLIPIVLFAFLLLTLFQKKEFVASLLVTAGFAVITTVSFLVMQVHPLDFLQRVAYNGGVYWQSLQTISLTFFPEARQFITLAFLFWVLGAIVSFWRKKVDPVTAYCVVILVYLLFASAAYWNWYILWVLPLLPLIKSKKLFFTIIIFSFTSLLAYSLLWVIHRINNNASYWPIVTYIFIFGPPILFYLLYQLSPRNAQKLLEKYQLDKLIAEKA